MLFMLVCLKPYKGEPPVEPNEEEEPPEFDETEEISKFEYILKHEEGLENFYEDTWSSFYTIQKRMQDGCKNPSWNCLYLFYKSI